MGGSAGIAAAGDMNCHDQMAMHLKMMDKNGDGMISKDEYMKFHETMWDKMKKNSDGKVSLKDMEMHHDGMKHDEMMKGDMKRDSISSTH